MLKKTNMKKQSVVAKAKRRCGKTDSLPDVLPDQMSGNERGLFLSEGETDVFVDPISDGGFKIIFERSGTPEGEEGPNEGELLLDMLNALAGGLIAPIKKIRFKNNEVHGETVNTRKTVFDIYFEEGTHRHFIVEMQNEEDGSMVDRALNDVSRVHSNALEKGKHFKHDQNQVVGIVIANFHLPG